MSNSFVIKGNICQRKNPMEENLYEDYLPKEYNRENVITYQWNQSREDNLQGQFNFYYNITKDSISRGSMFLYLVLLMAIAVIGDILADYVMRLIDLLT